MPCRTRESRLARAAISRRGSRIAPNRSSRRPSRAGADARGEWRGMPPRRALPGFSPAATWRRCGTRRRCGARNAARIPLLHEPAVHGPILPAALHRSRAVRRVVALGFDIAARIASSEACNVTLSVCATCLSNRIAHEMRRSRHRVCSGRIAEAQRDARRRSSRALLDRDRGGEVATCDRRRHLRRRARHRPRGDARHNGGHGCHARAAGRARRAARPPRPASGAARRADIAWRLVATRRQARRRRALARRAEVGMARIGGAAVAARSRA